MRIRFASLKRQQMSTSRVTNVAPCATAANPPIKTNSTCASTSLRVSSLRFCTTLQHRGLKQIGQTQCIVICQHPLPYGFRETLLKQRKINSVIGSHELGWRAVRPLALHCRLNWARLHQREVTPGATTVNCALRFVRLGLEKWWGRFGEDF